MQQPDHIVIVVEENHDADQVIGNANAPYINGTLLKNGLYYSNAHGTDHPSQPNYLEMFAGTNPGVQGVNSPLQQHYQPGNESTPAGQNALNHGDDYNTGQPFSAANLGAELLAAGKTFAGYSEDLPSVGFTGAQANGINGNRSYVEKHNPWAQFQGTGPNQLPADTNQPFTTFQNTTDFSKLPTVSFVVPNEYNDMHDTVSKNGLYADPSMGTDANGNPLDKFGSPVNDAGTIQNGDTWLSNNIEAYREWATTHNSLLITVWDENDYDFSNPNDIPMVIDGDPRLVQKGVNSSYVNHFDLLKTLESTYGLGLTGAAVTADGLSTNAAGKLLADHASSPLIDDHYYDASNSDVWAAHVDPTTHYNQNGWHEGRDPNADFSTVGYLAANQDVAKAGINPLTHYDQYGWKEGRDPSANFDNELYLKNNPDVAASGMDPLAHYLQYGQAEGRQTYAAIGNAADFTHGSFDAEYYLLANPDVAKAALAAGGDTFNFAYQHYESNGWKEGRAADAYFDSAYYLAHNPDVAAAHLDPLAHYDQYGWKEGRDPSAAFNTHAYLAANPDVAAAHIDPLTHYLQFGADEGRHLA